MGFCMSCCRDSQTSYETPTAEEKRQKMLEAAERRQHEDERRGLKNPENFKLKQQRTKKIDEALDLDGPGSQGPLRWQVS